MLLFSSFCLSTSLKMSEYYAGNVTLSQTKPFKLAFQNQKCSLFKESIYTGGQSPYFIPYKTTFASYDWLLLDMLCCDWLKTCLLSLSTCNTLLEFIWNYLHIILIVNWRMSVSDMGHLTIRFGLQLRFCANRTDMGKRVECDHQYNLCYSAAINCEYHEWFAKHQNITKNEIMYLRGCASPAIFGEK